MRHSVTNILGTLSFCAALTLFAASPAEARRSGGGGSQEALLFIAETTIPNPDGAGLLSLCHLVRHTTIFFIPVWTEIKGYAVAPDGCKSDSYYDVDGMQLRDGQRAGEYPIGLPAVAELPGSARMKNWAALAIGGGLLLLGLLNAVRKAIFGEGRTRRRGRKADMTTASRALAAMCQVAKVDGTVDNRELQMINATLARITGRSFPLHQIAQMAEAAEPSDDPRALQQIAAGLPPDERRIVLECALYVAVADGRIEPAEHAYISALSNVLGIGGDEFRSLLGRIAASLKARPAYA